MSEPATRTRCRQIIAATALLVFVHAMPLFAEEGPEVVPINRITGTVVDFEGKPVEGVQVGAANTKAGMLRYSGNGRLFVYGPQKRILLLFKARNGSAAVETHTDADGKFILSNLMDGRVNFAAAHPEHGVWFLENIDPLKDNVPLEIKLPKPRFLEGRIRGIAAQDFTTPFNDSEQTMSFGRFQPAEPKGGGGISWSMMTVVPADGSFRVGPLPEHIKQWKMTFEHRVANYSATVLEVPIELSGNDGPAIDLDLTKGHKMTGIVRGPKDELLSNVSVTARRSDGVVVGSVTDKKGVYTINGVTEGTLHLELQRWARRTAPG
ncbi:MAG: hypothetical protein GXP29_11155 [Planctomycetes bacterium]|nr:hypothetical protein [Planctomycetota bacterium]